MKTKVLLLIVALLTISVVSCQKQETPKSPESVAVITQPQDKGEPATEGTRPVTIAATCSWTAVSDSEDWLTVSPASGPKGMQEVILTFKANATGAPRTGKVTFTAGKYSETFTLVQNQ